jgi:S-formylglutathione hydrolase
MGGHGALISFLKNANLYKSVSAFAPISNPTECDWGKFAFNGYFGENQEKWKLHDSTHLINAYSGPVANILIDQGNDDNFLKQNQLLPGNLANASKENKLVNLSLRYHDVIKFFLY